MRTLDNRILREKRIALRIFIGIAAIIVGFFVLLLVFWLFSFRDPASAQNECTFKSVSRPEFQHMLAQARHQDWTVWPGLSNGLFWPSDRGLKNPTLSFEKKLSAQLEKAIRELTPGDSSVQAQLAAAHAIMRGIHAEYVGIFNIPDLRQNDVLVSTKVRFNYLIPQIRFAPLCFPCLLFWNTSITIVFNHDVTTDTDRFIYVNLLHSGFKYQPKYHRLPPTECPSFPRDKADDKRRADEH